MQYVGCISCICVISQTWSIEDVSAREYILCLKVNIVIVLHPGPPTPPTQVKIDLVTAKSATVSWQPGLERGHSQTFSVLLRPEGAGSFHQTQYGNNILDSGQNQIIKHVVIELEAETHYQFQVRARNRKGSVMSDMVDATTLSK